MALFQADGIDFMKRTANFHKHMLYPRTLRIVIWATAQHNSDA